MSEGRTRLVKRPRLVICGAAGRDFHNFNVVFRHDPAVEVVAFTATQIPGIEARAYPAALAGPLYPDGIPIVGEVELDALCRRERVDEVVFAYSDVNHAQVMRLASRVIAQGANFTLLGPRATMLDAELPVIAVCAVRTGCGKSQIARFLSQEMGKRGCRAAVIRHPMPYGQLEKQAVQRFADIGDLAAADCTLEEREEYEPHIASGGVVFAGADYAAVLEHAQREADVVLWDGGNNDFSFVRPDFSIAVVDALRPDQLDTHYPGDAVLRMADLVVINKVHAASPEQLAVVRAGLEELVPTTPVVMAASPVSLDEAEALKGARVLIVEDGPTITHGGMPYGAGYHAVARIGSAEVVDPRESATGEIAAVYKKYPHIGPVLPAMGYSAAQLQALTETINAAAVDFVVAGTPIDLAGVLDVRVPVVRARYGYRDAGEPGLWSYVDAFLNGKQL